MRFHGVPLVGIEWAVFVQNIFGDGDFSDVVENAAQTDFLDFQIAHAQRFGNERGVGGNFLRMALGVVILGVDGESQRSHGIEHGLGQGLRSLGSGCGDGTAIRAFGGRERFRKLFQAGINFFKGFRTGGEQPLQRYAEVGFQDIALPLFRFVGIEMIGGGNGVAALMFR